MYVFRLHSHCRNWEQKVRSTKTVTVTYAFIFIRRYQELLICIRQKGKKDMKTALFNCGTFSKD